MSILPIDFYLNEDVLSVSESLLGKVLLTRFDQQVTAGIIVETEAYAGTKDKACHAYGSRKTKRTEVMYRQGGISYIYLCYGIHHLMNVVTNQSGIPEVVLIRAIEPIQGQPIMQQRRGKKQVDKTLTAGPGALTQAMGITVNHNALSLLTAKFCILDEGENIDASQIERRPRVGIAYAEEHTLLPYRFSIKNNPWVSKAK